MTPHNGRFISTKPITDINNVLLSERWREARLAVTSPIAGSSVSLTGTPAREFVWLGKIACDDRLMRRTFWLRLEPVGWSGKQSAAATGKATTKSIADCLISLRQESNSLQRHQHPLTGRSRGRPSRAKRVTVRSWARA